MIRFDVSEVLQRFKRQPFAKMPRKLKNGVGAVGSLLTRFLHPSAQVRRNHNNVDLPKNHMTFDLLVDRKEKKYVNRREQDCCIVTSDEFVDGDGIKVELHVVLRNFKVTTEGDPALFFERPIANAQAPGNLVNQEILLPDEVINFDVVHDHINVLRQNGIEVDDDNEPLPENAVQEGVLNDTTVENMFGPWGFTGVCYRKEHHQQTDAKITNFRNTTKETCSVEWLFEQLFPVQYLKEVVLERLNDLLVPQVKYGELLRWIGIWFLIAVQQSAQLRDFWSRAPIDRYRGAPFRLIDLMSRDRFESILQCI